MGFDATKPAFSATETSLKIEISPVISFYMILSKRRITKALISVHGCADLSGSLLFANTKDWFSRAEAQMLNA